MTQLVQIDGFNQKWLIKLKSYDIPTNILDFAGRY